MASWQKFDTIQQLNQSLPVETNRREFLFDPLQFQYVFNTWVLKSHLIHDGVKC